jgi:hypothetical protein
MSGGPFDFRHVVLLLPIAGIAAIIAVVYYVRTLW